ncbi:hypothetical protein ISO79_15695 [Morganella morganii subsp. morganii]|uniref:hypothetical protein n=1 Tax=Morganella morganii TaxID=582 RepID=UPI001BDAA740|nr:hypothetical protein [Morganella morganii]MBT0375165.1 hypothetical protein [Morganella morganii subsp. morganii]
MDQPRNKFKKPEERLEISTGSYIPSRSIDLTRHNASYYPQRIIVVDNPYGKHENYQKANGGIMFSMTKTQFAITIFGFIGAMIVTTGSIIWSLSNHISNSNNEVRKELQASIESSKQGLTTAMTAMESRVNDRLTRADTQFDKMNSRIDRVESKLDENFKETNKNISDIKELIVKSK